MPAPEAEKPIVSLHRPRRGEAPAERIAISRPPFPGLCFHLPTPYPRPALIDLATFSRPLFAEQVARIIWVDHHDDVAFRSNGAAQAAMDAMRRFDEYLLSDDPNRAIRSLADVTSDHVDGFDLWAHARWPQDSSRPFLLLSAFVALLGRALKHRLASRDLAPRLAYVSRRNRAVDTTPRDAYSPHVMSQVREGARRAVRLTVLRMARARRSPVAEISPGRLTSGTDVVRHLLEVGFIEEHIPLRKRLVRGGQPSLGSLLDLVYPGLPDLVPFAILIADDCGLPPECIQELGADCVETREHSRISFLEYRKRRRNVTEETFSEPVDTKGRWSTGSLVRLLLALTKTTREQMKPGSGGESLFIGRAGTKLKSLRINKHAIEAHLARHPVHDELGTRVNCIDLSRIRKTSKAKRYSDSGGDLSRIGEDHTLRVFARHYGAIAALAGTHDASIDASLQAGLDDALRSTVLSSMEAEDLKNNPVGFAVRRGWSEEKVRNVSEGSTDVWLAGCLDYENSPYPGRTKACGAPLWGCLDCGNAVITPSKLPALLRLLEHLYMQRQTMDLTTFARSFGVAFVRLRQIIDRFPTAVVEAARAEAGDEGREWSPAQLTHNFGGPG